MDNSRKHFHRSLQRGDLAVIPRKIIVLLFLLLLIPGSVAAQGIADPKAGSDYAEKNCAECHATNDEDPASPVDKAPSFDAIANTQDISAIAISVLLQTPHRDMPNLVIPQTAREDLIAYILTLKD